MIRTLFATTLALLATSPALAAEQQSRTFQRDGVTYSYKTIEKDGYKVIEGIGDNREFRFEVRGNKVTGVANGEPVSFVMPEAQMTVDALK